MTYTPVFDLGELEAAVSLDVALSEITGYDNGDGPVAFRRPDGSDASREVALAWLKKHGQDWYDAREFADCGDVTWPWFIERYAAPEAYDLECDAMGGNGNETAMIRAQLVRELEARLGGGKPWRMQMIKFEVTNRFTGALQFTAEIDSAPDAPLSVNLGLAVRWATANKANLSRANLSGANLVDGGQRTDGYRFVGQIKDGALWVLAGCRYFTVEEARAHWTETRGGTPLGDESLAIVDHLERVARIRGRLGGVS